MNPADVFLQLVVSKGIARALIASFARIDEEMQDGREVPADSIRAIALSLPPGHEWNGLRDALLELCGPTETPKLVELSTSDRERVAAQFEDLNRRASSTPGGWSEELEREHRALMESLRKK